MYHIFRINKLRRYKRLIYLISDVKDIHNIGLNDIPKVEVADIRKLLRQKGFAVQDGFTSITTKCIICSEEKIESKKNESKLYVNKTTGK